MEFEVITRSLSTLVAAFVTFKAYTVWNSASGKVKKVAGFITLSMLALTIIEGLAFFGFDDALGSLMPFYWSSDIIVSVLLLGAVAALGSIKK